MNQSNTPIACVGTDQTAHAIGEAAPIEVIAEEWSAKMGPMSRKQYVAIQGVVCPSCGGQDLSGGMLEVDAGYCYQPMECSECGASWSDTYDLTGYADLEGGINIEAVDAAIAEVRKLGIDCGFAVDEDDRARECVVDSCGVLGITLSEPELKLAVSKLLS